MVNGQWLMVHGYPVTGLEHAESHFAGHFSNRVIFLPAQCLVIAEH